MCKQAKSKKGSNANTYTTCPPFPKQPWIYVSDPTDNNTFADKLHDMIDAAQFHFGDIDDDLFAGTNLCAADTLLSSLDKSKDARYISKKAFLIVDKLNRFDSENDGKIEDAKKVREHAARSGRTFASVNLYMREGTKAHELKKWGPKHLDLSVADLTPQQVVDVVYKWLCASSPLFLPFQYSLQRESLQPVY